MIKVKDIENATMTTEKRKEAHNNYFAFYIGRPLSYILTIPFLYTSITPNTVTMISIAFLAIGFLMVAFGKMLIIQLLGWLCFFLWNLFDGVDGNVARYKKLCSENGDLWDTMAGYLAMVTTYFSASIGAFYEKGSIVITSPEFYIILGGLSAIFSIFPRLMMHKKKSAYGNTVDVDNLSNKSEYGLVKIVSLNIISISGFVQIILLISICWNLLSLFTIGYFAINSCIMIVSLFKLLR